MVLPASSAEFYRSNQRITAELLAAAAQIWGDQPPADFDAWFAAHVDELLELVVLSQTRAVELASGYLDDVLVEQDIDAPPQAEPNFEPLIGVAGDGRPLDSLMYGAVIHSRHAISVAPQVNPASIQAGWAQSGSAALMVRLQTVVADTSRVATSLATIARPRIGYVRMLNPPSCSRCVVLAGRTYGAANAFDRHPGCDCRHIPSEEDAADARTDPAEYFDRLSAADQDKAFTVAGAQAIRDGADVAQVVNARRGVQGLAPASGRVTAAEAAAIRRRAPARGIASQATSEGTTRRGWAYRALRSGPGPTPPQRLMPEAIYQAAGEDRERAFALLVRHGYLLAMSQ